MAARKKDTAPAWRREPMVARLHTCAVMLSVHGLVTDAERRRIHKRLVQLVSKRAKLEASNG